MKSAAHNHGLLCFYFFGFECLPDRLPHEAFALACPVRGDTLWNRGGPGGGTKRCQLPTEFLGISKVADLKETIPGLVPRTIARGGRQLLVEAAFDNQLVRFLLDSM